MDTLLEMIARNWWVFLLRGVAAILFGLAAFFWPELSIAVLVLMFGAFILVDGVFGLIDALRQRGSDRWGYLALESALGIVVGALTLVMPGVTAFVLLVSVAAWSILGGALRIAAAINLRKHIEGEWFLILSGVLSVFFGLAILILPHAGLVSIAWIIGFWAIAFGTLFVLSGVRLRKIVS